MTPEITAAVELITPSVAAQALAEHASLESQHGQLNRRIRSSRVQSYATIMRDGGWQLNGEPIQFSGKQLLNGQHRLRAIVEAGVSVPMLVVRGVSPQAFATLDQGLSRGLVDLLGVRMRYHAMFTAAVALAWRYEHHGTMDRQSSALRAAPQQLAAYAQPHMARWEGAIHAASPTCGILARPAVLCALHYLVAPTREAQSLAFLSALATGELLSPDRPVYQLRERMIRERSASAADTGVIAALVIKAWNAEVTGVPTHLRYRPSMDAFPVIIK